MGDSNYGDLSMLRAAGWVVACHNDYRLDGELRTLWLFTRGDQAIRGEGPTDQAALLKAVKQWRRLAAVEISRGTQGHATWCAAVITGARCNCQ